MLEATQLLSIVWITSCVLEKDTGRVISAHMVFNEKTGGIMMIAWLIVGVIKLTA